MLEGQEGAQINVTLVHPSGPDPGIYKIELLGYDEDNDVSSPFTLFLDVPVLSQTRLEFDYTTIPVHPTEVTSVDFRLFNLGNGDIGYDLFLESPPGWYAGFDDLSAQGRCKFCVNRSNVRGWTDEHRYFIYSAAGDDISRC